MAEDIQGLRQLARVLFWAGAYIVASMAYYILTGLASGAHSVPLVGGQLASWIRSAEAPIVNPLNALRAKSDAEIARGLSGLLDDLAIWLGIGVLLAEGTKAALTYLWRTALKPFVLALTLPERLAAQAAKALATAAHSYAEHLYELAVSYIDSRAARALGDARSYADARASAAGHAAEAYADRAVSKLRDAEQGAVSSAVAIAVAGAESADHALGRAIDDVRGIAVGAEQDIEALIRDLGGAGAVGLIAALPALATLLRAIATETGLENAECRAKVKQVCATDPSAWAGLLEGLAALALALEFRELVELMRPELGLVGDLLHAAA